MVWDGRSPTRAAGVQPMTTVTTDVVVNVTVTFVPPFANGVVPIVKASVVTTRPDLNRCSVGTATNTGVALYLVRTGGAATLDVNWQAEVPTQ